MRIRWQYRFGAIGAGYWGCRVGDLIDPSKAPPWVCVLALLICGALVFWGAPAGQPGTHQGRG